MVQFLLFLALLLVVFATGQLLTTFLVMNVWKAGLRVRILGGAVAAAQTALFWFLQRFAARQGWLVPSVTR